ncbi:MAG: hypothetical protein R3Y54_12320 [Eubacteriales bacterium]
MQLNLVEEKKVLVYENFQETFKSQKFDFICIDDPFGMNQTIARIDILKIIPDCLQDRFVILLDDLQREGEQRTLLEIERVMSENGIAYAKGIYSGVKSTVVLCSEDMKFLCTL